MSASPYQDKQPHEWLEITKRVVDAHPLEIPELIELVQDAWAGVWSTVIGTTEAKLSLREISPPATVVGYMFEKLLAKALETRYPGVWAGGKAGNEKDLHFVNDGRFSVEVKTSGQMGLKIFGNRSYGQEVANTDRAKKDKSGYYITVNFFGDRLNLVRFGWIDGSDWQAQSSATGQMAGLCKDVYAYKLIPIAGDYTLNAPVVFLPGIGPSVAAKVSELGVNSVRDVLAHPELFDGKLARVYAAAVEYENAYGATKAATLGHARKR